MDPVNVAVSLIVGLSGGGGAVALFKVRSESRKTNADSAAVLTQAALEMLEPLRRDLEAAREEVKDLRAEVRELRDENAEYHRRFGPLSPPVG